VQLLGLTGGIATGKSTVAARLRGAGVPVIDADDVAREVVSVGTVGLEEIVKAFGPNVLDRLGGLDRKALARLVFSSTAARATLEAITHPLIASRTSEYAAALESRGEPIACYEAALLVESGIADRYRPLVVCACPETLQLTRLQARDGLSENEAFARVRAQLPLSAKIAMADHVLATDGSMDDTRRRADELLARLCRQWNVDPARYGL
jgi:dephospho-CoA kinase